MKISSNAVVAFHYNLYNEARDLVETTRQGEPSLFLVGTKSVMPAMEQAMLGRESGESFELTLEPHQAYGLRQADKQQRVSAKYLKHEGKLKPGQMVSLQSDKGRRVATVIKVGKFSVDVDLNHPLAGQTIRFEIEIKEVREATHEEISHGHAHGAGGHHH